MRKFLAAILFVLFLSANDVFAFGSINAAAYRPMYQSRPSTMYTAPPNFVQRYSPSPTQMPYWQRQSNYVLRTNAQNTLRSNAQNLNRNYSAAQQRSSSLYGYRH